MSTAAQSVWSAGDFSMVGGSVIIVSEMLCDSLPVHAGQSVLDVATGSGNTALAAARRGAKTTGVDFVPELLARARERAAAERLHVEFQEGNAESLPFPDEAFDVVTSTFGAMFADPARAASEMLRVCRPGGKIAMANWTPTSMVAEMSAICARYMAPHHEPPYLWGDPEVAARRFGGAREVRIVRREVLMRHYTPESWVKFMKKYFGPMIAAHQAAGDRAGELTAALEELARKRNESGDSSLLARSEYIEVIAVKVAAPTA